MHLNWLIVRAIAKRIAPLLKQSNRQLIEKYQNSPNYPIAFIIGAPRSGSTILYQTITNYFNTAYISNLIEAFKEIPAIGAKLHYLLFDHKPHNSFQSKYGRTKKLIAPAEGTIWYKWLPKGKHYLLPHQISEKNKQQFKAFINFFINYFNNPLVIKNLSFSLKLELIKELFPNAIIIFIQRDLFFNAQSLYLAYKKNKVPPNQIWSIAPPNYQQIQNLSLEEKVVAQLFYILQHINQKINIFSPEQVIKIKYEQFVLNPNNYLDLINKKLNAQKRKNTNTLKIHSQNKIKLEPTTAEKINYYLKKYFGND